MTRQLEDEEKRLAEKNLKNLNKELAENEEELEVRKKTLEFIQVQREYNDFVRPYNRRVENTNHNNLIKIAEAQIKESKFMVESTEKQITDGVETKPKPVGVN